MRSKTLLLIGMTFLIVHCGGSGGGKKLAEVNGEPVTEGDLQFATRLSPQSSLYLSTPEGKKRAVDGLIEKELLYRSALKEGLDGNKEVKSEIKNFEKEVLAKARVEKAASAAAKKYYDEHKNEFEQIRLAHILIQTGSGKQKKRSEEEALKLVEEIKTRLQKGDDFAKLAQQFSEDMLTKNQGGDLGVSTKEDRRLERQGLMTLLEKASTLKAGEVFGPVKTERGLHIVKLTEGPKQKSFEEVKDGIIFKLKENARQELIGKLKEKAKVKYYLEK